MFGVMVKNGEVDVVYFIVYYVIIRYIIDFYIVVYQLNIYFFGYVWLVNNQVYGCVGEVMYDFV